MTDYGHIDSLHLYYLEDSWVLDILAMPGTLTMTLDVVLLPEHPDCGAPLPGERYCYRRGELKFEGVTSLHWTEQGLPPAKDASGGRDYGGIDSLAFDQGVYSIAGDFGKIVMHAELIQMQLLPTEAR
ncbi:hypothetical protein AB0869_29225 [Micromonospora vinacea]|uniref:hypothetical protein n=1 Tax=Micromonospora vinacea TaxID=709878 RepID=UPI003451A20B